MKKICLTFDTDEVISNETDKCPVVIKSYEVTTNTLDENILYVIYEWTNNSDETQCARFDIYIHAYQDGIQLEHDMSYNYEEEHNEYYRSITEVKPGTTITVMEGFLLNNTKSDVEIEITPWISLTDEVYVTDVYKF